MELRLKAVKAARIKVLIVKKRQNISCLMIYPSACQPRSAFPSGPADPLPPHQVELQTGGDNSVSADNIYAPDAEMIPVIRPTLGRGRCGTAEIARTETGKLVQRKEAGRTPKGAKEQTLWRFARSPIEHRAKRYTGCFAIFSAFILLLCVENFGDNSGSCWQRTPKPRGLADEDADCRYCTGVTAP